MSRAVLACLATLVVSTSAHGAALGKAGTSPSSLGFDLHIQLSKQAARELGRRKEGVTVSASFSGDPKPAAKRHANEVGLIDLGRETFTLRGIDGPARVTGATVDRTKMGWIAGPPMVNVNVFTARRTSPNNLITCDIIDGPVPRVSTGKTTLFCGLISEKRDVVVYPR